MRLMSRIIIKKDPALVFIWRSKITINSLLHCHRRWWAFANSVDLDEMAHNEPSHQEVLCLTFSLSDLHINLFPVGSLIKQNKADDKCRPKYGAVAIIIIIIIIKTLFSVGNTISYKLLFLEAHLTKYIQTTKICKQNKARTHIQFVQIRH